jgi:hypothetical protein
MKIKLSPWSVILGLLILLMVASMLGLVPYVSPMNVFWLVVTVACVWGIMTIFFPKKKT